MRWIFFCVITMSALPAAAEEWVIRGGVKTGLVVSRTPGVSETKAEEVPVDLNFVESHALSTVLRPFISIGADSSGFLELGMSYHNVEFQSSTRKRNILGETYETITQTDQIQMLHIPLMLRFAFVPNKTSPRGLQNAMWGLGASLNHPLSHRRDYTSDQRSFIRKDGFTTIDGIQHRTNLDTAFAIELSLSVDLKIGKVIIPFELGGTFLETHKDVALNDDRTIATQVSGFEWQVFLVSGVGYDFATF